MVTKDSELLKLGDCRISSF